MPWLTRESKSTIDNSPPFSHRSTSSAASGQRIHTNLQGGGCVSGGVDKISPRHNQNGMGEKILPRHSAAPTNNDNNNNQ